MKQELQQEKQQLAREKTELNLKQYKLKEEQQQIQDQIQTKIAALKAQEQYLAVKQRQKLATAKDHFQATEDSSILHLAQNHKESTGGLLCQD